MYSTARSLPLLVLLALVVGCSSGSGESGSGPSGTTTSTVALTTSTVPTTDTAPTASSAPATSTGPTITTALAPSTTTTLWPALAGTPEALAAQLTRLERLVRSTTATPDEIAAAGREQQLAYRRFAAHPEWDEAVLASVAADVHDAVFNNIEARRAFTRDPSSRPPSDVVPAWRLVEPRPADELVGYYKEAEALIGIEWEYLAAINLIETRMGRIEGLSTAGAQGPMQFLPSTWADCCEGDIEDPRDAIIGAATYLRIRGGPTDMDRAIFGYNNDYRYVAAVKAYAANIRADERAYAGYHAWQVFYASSAGDIRLPIGYEQIEPMAAADYLVAHPEDRLPPT